jgi:hypothetical protein
MWQPNLGPRIINFGIFIYGPFTLSAKAMVSGCLKISKIYSSTTICVMDTTKNEMAFDVAIDVRTMLQYEVNNNKCSNFEMTSKALEMHY